MKGKIVPWLWALVGIVVVSRTAANVYRLWQAGGRVKQAEGQLARLKQENEVLNQQLQEVETPEYMERLVREKLGYGKPGEVVVVIPEDINSKSKALSSKEEVPNWKQWRKLYLGF